MTLLTPYAIDGAQHPAAVFRRQLQYALGDGSGIARPGDFKVLPLNQPGRGVRISAGGVIIQSRESETASRETYGVENDGEFEFFGGDGATGIPGTGSGETRRDMIVVEIRDPEMAGVPEPSDWDAAEFSRIRVLPGVPAGVTRVEDLTNPAYANLTAYCLAVIVWPASTTTITAGMIQDAREVQNPRTKRSLRTFALTAQDGSTITATTAYPTGGQTWPISAELDWGPIMIPSWATRARIIMTWAGVNETAGNAWGQVWVQVAPTVNASNRKTQAVAWNSVAGNDSSRSTYIASDDIAIPAALRGAPQRFYPRATKTSGPAAAASRLDGGSSMILDVEFYEAAV